MSLHFAYITLADEGCAGETTRTGLASIAARPMNFRPWVWLNSAPGWGEETRGEDMAAVAEAFSRCGCVGSLGRSNTTDRAPPPPLLANSSHPSFSLSFPGRPLSDPPASQPDRRPRPRPLASPAKDATSKPPNAARPPVASGSGHILLVAAPSRPLLTPYPSVPRGMPRPKAARPRVHVPTARGGSSLSHALSGSLDGSLAVRWHRSAPPAPPAGLLLGALGLARDEGFPPTPLASRLPDESAM